MDSKKTKCVKDTIPEAPYKKTLVGSFLPNSRWSISEKSFLGKYQKFYLKVNFSDSHEEKNFFDDFRENGSLEFFSSDVEHITHLIDLTSVKEDSSTIVFYIEYLRSTPELVLSLMLRDSPKNDKSENSKNRLLQQDGYQIGLLLPQTI